MAASREKAKGRREDGAKPKFVKLDHWVMDTEAWLDLDPVARCAYIEVRREWKGPGIDNSGTNNGRIGVGVRNLAEKLGVSKNTAARALRSLQEHGFIVAMSKGAFTRKIRHSTEYRITDEVCGVTGSLPSKDFARWRKNTVPLMGLTVPQVGPIGTRGGTQASRGAAQNHLCGPSGETVSASVGPSSGTHIGLPSQASDPRAGDGDGDGAGAVDVVAGSLITLRRTKSVRDFPVPPEAA